MLKTATSLLFYATAFCAAARAAVPFLPPVTLYVANEGQIDGSGSSVSVIDGRSLRTKATIDFGKAGPIYALATPDGKLLWAVHYVYNNNTGLCDGSGVSVVSLATKKIETTLNLPQCPTTLAFSPNGRFAYVPSPAGPLTVIDTAVRTRRRLDYGLDRTIRHRPEPGRALALRRRRRRRRASPSSIPQQTGRCARSR